MVTIAYPRMDVKVSGLVKGFVAEVVKVVEQLLVIVIVIYSRRSLLYTIHFVNYPCQDTHAIFQWRGYKLMGFPLLYSS